MRKCEGVIAVNNDEWYTPRETADVVAKWLYQHLSLDTPILCPADILPDGTISEIPKSLQSVGFKYVRVTRDLPIIEQVNPDYKAGEVIVTNPPFSLLVPFRKWIEKHNVKYCVLSRPGSLRLCWSIPELTDKFKSTEGKTVCAAWHQNIYNTSSTPPTDTILDNCQDCERKACPNNNMTSDWIPGRERPLYGWGTAAQYGLVGWNCHGPIINGKNRFTRFFIPSNNQNISKTKKLW